MYTEAIALDKDKDYLKPHSVSEVLALIAQYGQDASLLAGATDLYAMRTVKPLTKVLIDITDAGLDYLTMAADGLRIGACATCDQIIRANIEGALSVVAESAKLLGSPQIRNMATIGGNICNAAPSADLLPALYVLGGVVKLTGNSGSRTVPIQDFITGPGQTVKQKEELLEEIFIPLPQENTYTLFDKAVRTKGLDLALVNCAIAVVIGEAGAVQSCRICMGAVAPTPVLMDEAEALLIGHKLTEERIQQVAQKVAESVKPISDVRASADYRRLRSRVMVERGLRAIVEQTEQK